MEPRADARRELVLATVLLVAVGGLVGAPAGLFVAALVALALAAGAVGVYGRTDPRTVPPESVVLPAVLGGGSVGALGLLPVGLAWLPALAALAFGLRALLRLEGRLIASTASPGDDERVRLQLGLVATAFVAFAGVAALVPGGLADIGSLLPGGGEPPTFTEQQLLALVAGDALVAGLLGFRAAALRYPTLRDRLWSALTYAIVVAVAAGAARAIGLPRLVGPAVLTLVFYLWDAIHGTAPGRRREARFVWETVLLVLVGIVVVAWNLRLRP